jgi:VIT1/CCC1 family predicted Fe2+/Mn2+ transporter
MAMANQPPPPITSADVARYRGFRQDEIDAAHLYRAMATSEDRAEIADLYLRLADSEDRHAVFWEQQLEQGGAPMQPRRPTWRAKTLSWIARRFGATAVLPTVAQQEQADRRVYDHEPESANTALPGDERSHARVLGVLSGTRGGVEGSLIGRLEGRHRHIGGNALRAAVLGANDGLVSNLSLVMAVAGAELESRTIFITGVAGLLAGAISMALGEWISVQSSRELYEQQIEVEREEIRMMPEEEAEELELIYRAKGFSAEDAKQVASRLMENEETALKAMAREELGIEPDDLGGSPWVAAFSSFVLFSLGAIGPVAPFAFLDGATAIITSLIVSSVALFIVGGGITLLTGRNVWYAGGRQLAFGLIASGVTFAIGRAIGVTVGG